MKILKKFGVRRGYLKETHIAFLIKAMYRPKSRPKPGSMLDIFVEASIDDNEGIRRVSLRENGTNKTLLLENLDKDGLHELIIKLL